MRSECVESVEKRYVEKEAERSYRLYIVNCCVQHMMRSTHQQASNSMTPAVNEDMWPKRRVGDASRLSRTPLVPNKETQIHSLNIAGGKR